MEYFFEALQVFLAPSMLAVCMAGGIAGVIFGAIPGLSGGTCMILALPITYGMDANMAVALLTSIWVGGTSGSFIGSILLGIPGSVASIATVYDGYEFTRQVAVCRDRGQFSGDRAKPSDCHVLLPPDCKICH